MLRFYRSIMTINIDFTGLLSSPAIQTIADTLLGPLLVGISIFILGQWVVKRKIKGDTITDLMTYRGDYASRKFQQALNRVSIAFHKDEKVREQVRNLYQTLSNPSVPPQSVERAIVGLIYNLCHRFGFKGLTEYDIDQSFLTPSQTPSVTSLSVSPIKTSEKKPAKSAK